MRKMQIKTTVRYHSAPIRRAITIKEGMEGERERKKEREGERERKKERIGRNVEKLLWGKVG